MSIMTTLDWAVSLARLRPDKSLARLCAILETKRGSYVGYNSRKTHPLAKKFGKHDKAICLHAEVDAIRRCISLGDSPEGGVLSVARVLKDGSPALAKPCKGCQRAIIAFSIKDCVWTI